MSTYSRFIYSIPLMRPNWGYFLKLFFGLFVFLTLAESTLSLKLYNGDEAGRRRSKRLERWSFAVLLALYVGLSAAAVAWY